MLDREFNHIKVADTDPNKTVDTATGLTKYVDTALKAGVDAGARQLSPIAQQRLLGLFPAVKRTQFISQVKACMTPNGDIVLKHTTWCYSNTLAYRYTVNHGFFVFRDRLCQGCNEHEDDYTDDLP